MSLKEKLKNIKESIFEFNYLIDCHINKDYEFEANLENHPLGNQNIYRLRYMNYHRTGTFNMSHENNIEVVDCPLDLFMLPDNMSRNDAFKILSYLKDYIERDLNLEKCLSKSILELNNFLNIKKLGFKKVNRNNISDENDIIDLFTITGRQLLFKNSKYYSKYFEWYTPNVTFEEIYSIYKKCDIDLYDSKSVKEKTKILK